MSYNEQIYQKRWDDLGQVSQIWKVLVEQFFQPLVGDDATVLDIACGYCHFLNHLQAKEKIGVDANPAVVKYAREDVTIRITDDLSLKILPDNHFDRIFISNFLEHLSGPSAVIALLERVRGLLKPGGKVIVLQPNFRLLGAAYFDFIDHTAILTDRSLEEAFRIADLTVEKRIIRFLPYTTRSRFPQHPLFVSLYLKFPLLWLFLGKQSLYVATKTR